MKVGMVFECSPVGADGKVYPCLAKKLRSDLDIIYDFLDSKPKLTERCGESVKQLLEDKKCEKVVIIWDLRPAWPPNPNLVGKTKACPVQDCLCIQTAFDGAQLTPQQRDKIHLICIVQELEVFFLIDDYAVREYLEKITGRSCKVQSIKNPERVLNPKERLYDIFQQNGCRKYDDLRDAEKIARLVDINKLRRSKAFARFEKTIRLL